jgi:hypothetical protein
VSPDSKTDFENMLFAIDMDCRRDAEEYANKYMMYLLSLPRGVEPVAIKADLTEKFLEIIDSTVETRAAEFGYEKDYILKDVYNLKGRSNRD